MRSEGEFPTVPPPPDPHRPPPFASPVDTELGGALHPAAVAVWSAGQLGAVLFLVLINPVSLVALVPFAVVVLGVSGVRYSRFRWRIADGALVIDQGLINQQRRVIPLERIQSVDLVRRITHRLFGVVAIQVEAIGAGDTEGRLDALSPAQAAHVRSVLLAGRDGRPIEAPGAGSHEEEQGHLLAAVTPRQLLVAGATEANATLIAAVAGIGWQILGDRVEELAERLPTLLGTRGALVLTLGLIVLAVVLLILAQIVTYWSFRLRRTPSELRIRRGLTEQRYDTIPLRRVQALRIEENLPRRLLHLAAVRADVAGKPGGGSGGTDTLLPIGQAADARRLIEQVLDAEGLGDVALESMPRRARQRRRFRALLAVGVATGGAVFLWGPAGLAALALAIPAIAAADAAYRALGHAELEGYLVVRAGWWVRRTAFVPTDRLQTLALSATAFQRWRGLATLHLQIARSPGLWNGPQMIDLDAELGATLTRELSAVLHSQPSALDREAAPAR